MSRIYISSSWSNQEQQSLVEELRNQGHKVYDFRHPDGRNDSNVWEELGINRNNVSVCDYQKNIEEDRAIWRFEEHFKAMTDADTCVLLLPCGRSSHVEAGYMKGLGKRVLVFCSSNEMVPELMYRIFDGFYHEKDDLFEELEKPQRGICKVCGCSNENPCYHPVHGYCWWVDDSQTLCSHCAHLEDEGEYCIADDPLTEHCINDVGNAFK